MFATAVTFPLKRPLRGLFDIVESEAGQGLYDPAFVLPLYGMTLAGNLTGLEWVEVLRSNVIAVAIAALSSRHVEMRSMAGWLLSKTMTNLEVIYNCRAQDTYLTSRVSLSKKKHSYFTPFAYFGIPYQPRQRQTSIHEYQS